MEDEPRGPVVGFTPEQQTRVQELIDSAYKRAYGRGIKAKAEAERRGCMEIPDKISIGGLEYEVRMVDGSSIKDLGMFDSLYQIIKVRRERPESGQAETLLHEIFEAVVHTNQLTMSHQEMSTLSNGLFAAIRDNNLDFRKKED